MHPNWKALATLHYPPQLFVTEGETSCSNKRKKSKVIPENITGEDAAKFYEKIVSTTPSVPSPLEAPQQPAEKKLNRVLLAMPFNEKEFFKAAMQNDSCLIERMIHSNLKFINTVDQYGWTALMMAACDGCSGSVNMLLEYGADTAIKDKKGYDALSLATKNHHAHIIKELQKQTKPQNSAPDMMYEEFHCDLCNQKFKEITKNKHRCSTLHQLNIGNKYKYSTRYGIPDSNRGFQLMIKQGWDRDKGLGPNEDGKLYPVKTVIRKYRNGIGVEQQSAKVTHFGPNDLNAIKTRVNHPKSQTKRQLNKALHKNRIQERILRNELS